MATAKDQFSVQTAKLALSAMLEAFKQPENASQLREARENAGNDMLKMMQLVFPMATRLQMEVILKYGFTGDGDGLIEFATAVKSLEPGNEEVAQLNSELRSLVIPQMAAPEPTASNGS